MRFLVDEMFPPRTCRELTARGHDAVHVRDRGVDARPDVEVAAVARAEQRTLVTENAQDFATDAGIVVLFVLKSRLPSGGLHVHLAELVHRWAEDTPDPYVGPHWP
ncbi:MAG: DUF5615 family PIN-like protein [Kineosporiaceae bacterium]